ncbi:putative electron transfer protein [uncultured delta proteobacterium]|uniref:Putative electron transfer protein n=1 Tax=uncultured delta proteobacterium TaxID=34034 RepID=A0A212K2I6_9DELT|nr:putative electron transfer protein [uncultured delta proteobacterium]
MGKIYTLPLKQSIGMAATPVIATGQRVARGTLLAEPQGLGVPLHASVSGVVRAITETAIEIEADAAQGTDYEPLPPCSGIVETVKAAGICGMGGAGFPTYVKLGTNLNGGTVIINAVECEPILHHNITQIEQNPAKIYRGLLLAMEATDARSGIIAIKAKNKDAVAALKGIVTGADNVTIAELPDRYPMGEERAIIRETLKKLLPVEDLPSAAGAVIINAETASRIAEAVDERRPVISKNLTLAGRSVNGTTPRIFMDVPVGTKIRDLIDEAGGLTGEYGEIIMGGPFTGRHAGIDDAVVKTTGGILVRESCLYEPLPMGILVCACGPNGVRMREIAKEMNAEVVAVQVCTQAKLVKGALKCENPGICPGQAGKMRELQDAGAKVLLIGNCYDCTRDIVAEAPKMGLAIHHVTDAVMRSMGMPLVRGFPGEAR